eukprot:5475196-Pleurochrysis_carterae.AAC.1
MLTPVARLTFKMLCPHSFNSELDDDHRRTADSAVSMVFASCKAPLVLVVIFMPSRVRTASIIMQQHDPGDRAGLLQAAPSPKALLSKLWYLQASPTNVSIAVAALSLRWGEAAENAFASKRVTHFGNGRDAVD